MSAVSMSRLLVAVAIALCAPACSAADSDAAGAPAAQAQGAPQVQGAQVQDALSPAVRAIIGRTFRQYDNDPRRTDLKGGEPFPGLPGYTYDGGSGPLSKPGLVVERASSPSRAVAFVVRQTLEAGDRRDYAVIGAVEWPKTGAQVIAEGLGCYLGPDHNTAPLVEDVVSLVDAESEQVYSRAIRAARIDPDTGAITPETRALYCAAYLGGYENYDDSDL